VDSLRTGPLPASQTPVSERAHCQPLKHPRATLNALSRGVRAHNCYTPLAHITRAHDTGAPHHTTTSGRPHGRCPCLSPLPRLLGEAIELAGAAVPASVPRPIPRPQRPGHVSDPSPSSFSPQSGPRLVLVSPPFRWGGFRRVLWSGMMAGTDRCSLLCGWRGG
jgi:hypothetical protein